MKNFFKILVLLASLFLISACSTLTTAQKERRGLYREVQRVAGQAQSCYNVLSNDKRYSELYARFALQRKPATSSELSNPDRVSDEMVKLILDWYAQHQVCDNEMLSGFGRMDGSLEIVAIKWLRDRAGLLHRIIESRPTYGSVNAELDVLKIREKEEFKEWVYGTEKKFTTQNAREVEEQDRVDRQRKDFVLSAAVSLANSLLNVLNDLAEIQVELAKAQMQYSAMNAAFVPVHVISPVQPRISTTNCTKNMWGFSCTHY